MAKAKLNPVLEQVRGALGDVVFKRYGDRIILSRKPDLSYHKATAAQRMVRSRFGEAIAYGKRALQDPEAREAYQRAARRKRHPVFSVIQADYFRAPVVEGIDLLSYTGRVGDAIAIDARDDFEVREVRVAITMTNEEGTLLEEGLAIAGGGSTWTYSATASVAAGTEVRVTAIAKDRPGGTGRMEVVKGV